VFRHCVVVIDGHLIQIATDGVKVFRLGAREIRRLERAGWIFIECGMLKLESEISAYGKIQLSSFNIPQFLTCVGFAKRAVGIRAPFVLTPDQLFRFLYAQ